MIRQGEIFVYRNIKYVVKQDITTLNILSCDEKNSCKVEHVVKFMDTFHHSLDSCIIVDYKLEPAIVKFMFCKDEICIWLIKHNFLIRELPVKVGHYYNHTRPGLKSGRITGLPDNFVVMVDNYTGESISKKPVKVKDTHRISQKEFDLITNGHKNDYFYYSGHK